MTTIYVIRHGETDSNIRHTCLGHKDVPLNAAGRAQAAALAKRLDNVRFDAVYSSPLERAVQTVAPILKKGVQLTLSYDLIERDFGDWDDMTFNEIREADPHGYVRWKENWIDYVVPGGESSAQVQARVNTALEKILSAHKGQTIALVTHLGTARHIISRLLDLTPLQSWLFAFDNAKYAQIEIGDTGRGLLRGLNL